MGNGPYMQTFTTWAKYIRNWPSFNQTFSLVSANGNFLHRCRIHLLQNEYHIWITNSQGSLAVRALRERVRRTRSNGSAPYCPTRPTRPRSTPSRSTITPAAGTRPPRASSPSFRLRWRSSRFCKRSRNKIQYVNLIPYRAMWSNVLVKFFFLELSIQPDPLAWLWLRIYVGYIWVANGMALGSKP